MGEELTKKRTHTYIYNHIYPPRTVAPWMRPKLWRSLPRTLGRSSGYCSMMDLGDWGRFGVRGGDWKGGGGVVWGGVGDELRLVGWGGCLSAPTKKAQHAPHKDDNVQREGRQPSASQYVPPPPHTHTTTTTTQTHKSTHRTKTITSSAPSPPRKSMRVCTTASATSGKRTAHWWMAWMRRRR